jgi:hypothetical protein
MPSILRENGAQYRLIGRSMIQVMMRRKMMAELEVKDENLEQFAIR